MVSVAPCSGCGNSVDVALECPYCAAGADLQAPGDAAPAPAEPDRLVDETEVRLLDYRSTYNLGVVLQLMLALYVAIAVWFVAASLPYLRELVDLRDSGAIDDAGRFLAIESEFRWAAGSEGVALLLTGLVWIVWFYRSYRNLGSLGHRNAHAVWWAIFGWVIPLVSLYRPRQIAGELWVGSRPPDRTDLGAGLRAELEVPWYLNAWWGFFVVTNLALAVNRLSAFDPSFDSYVAVLRGEVGVVVAMALSATVALLVVGSINNGQAARARSLEAAVARRL